MFFSNSSDDDPYGDIKRREEYERQRQINMSNGLFRFLYLYILYGMVWMFSSVLISFSMNHLFNMHLVFSTVIGMIFGLILFKIPYIKLHPVKSLITIGFLFFLIDTAFLKIS
jgi:hypothetical protein